MLNHKNKDIFQLHHHEWLKRQDTKNFGDSTEARENISNKKKCGTRFYILVNKDTLLAHEP